MSHLGQKLPLSVTAGTSALASIADMIMSLQHSADIDPFSNELWIVERLANAAEECHNLATQSVQLVALVSQ